MLTLTSITFESAPRIPGIRAGDLTTLKLAEPAPVLKGFRALIRGAMLLLVSPPGWAANTQPRDFAPAGATTIFEIPRSNCYLQWTGDQADIDATIAKGKFDSAPFGPAAPSPETLPAKGILSQLDPAQMGDA